MIYELLPTDYSDIAPPPKIVGKISSYCCFSSVVNNSTKVDNLNHHMKIHTMALALLAVFSTKSYSAYQEREYNTWYYKDAVLYDMTQTSDGLPVMLSISQPGRSTANMLVSYMSEGACSSGNQVLSVNSQFVPTIYRCIAVGPNKIEHFAINDAKRVNDMINYLKSDFTLLLQSDIKVWAANIKSPKYGLSPRF